MSADDLPISTGRGRIIFGFMEREIANARRAANLSLTRIGMDSSAETIK